MSDSLLTEDEQHTLRGGRIDSHGYSLVRVDRTELISGERVLVCEPGEHPLWRGIVYNVLKPANLWSLGWFLDEPRDHADDRPHVAEVLRDDVRDEGSVRTSYAVPRHATRGVLVLFVYAVRGRFRKVQNNEVEDVVADVLQQMATNPVNDDAVGVIHLPLGYSLATLDAARIEFWRREQLRVQAD